MRLRHGGITILGALICYVWLGDRLAADSDVPTSYRLAQAYDCQKYERDALEATRVQRQLDCNFGGPRWDSREVDHWKFCSTAPYDQIIREVEARARSVWACQNAHADCVAYSETATEQQWANQNQTYSDAPHCEGPRWSYDAPAHEYWCSRVSPEERRNETIARGKALSGGPC